MADVPTFRSTLPPVGRVLVWLDPATLLTRLPPPLLLLLVPRSLQLPALRAASFAPSEPGEDEAPPLRFAARSRSLTRASSLSLRVVSCFPAAAGRPSSPSSSMAPPPATAAPSPAVAATPSSQTPRLGPSAVSAFFSPVRLRSPSTEAAAAAAGAGGSRPGREKEKSEPEGDVGAGDGGTCGRWPTSRAAWSRRLTRISFLPETGRRRCRRNSLS